MSFFAKIAANLFKSPALSFINSAGGEASGTSLAIAKPTNTVDGNLMVGFMGSQTVTATWTGDTGWTEQYDQASGTNTHCLRVATKVAASEGSSYTFTFSAGGKRIGGHILTYAHAAFDVAGVASAIATPTVAPQITVTADNSRLIAFYVSANASVTFPTPTGMTAVASNSDGTTPSWAIFEQTVNSGATGTRSSTPSSGSASGLLISIKPSM